MEVIEEMRSKLSEDSGNRFHRVGDISPTSTRKESILTNSPKLGAKKLSYPLMSSIDEEESYKPEETPCAIPELHVTSHEDSMTSHEDNNNETTTKDIVPICIAEQSTKLISTYKEGPAEHLVYQNTNMASNHGTTISVKQPLYTQHENPSFSLDSNNDVMQPSLTSPIDTRDNGCDTEPVPFSSNGATEYNTKGHPSADLPTIQVDHCDNDFTDNPLDPTELLHRGVNRLTIKNNIFSYEDSETLGSEVRDYSDYMDEVCRNQTDPRRRCSILAWIPPGNNASEQEESDLLRLKAMAERLKLQTKRPSIVAWQEGHMDSLERAKLQYRYEFSSQPSLCDESEQGGNTRTRTISLFDDSACDVESKASEEDLTPRDNLTPRDETDSDVEMDDVATIDKSRQTSLDSIRSDSSEDERLWFLKKKISIDRSLAWLKTELKAMREQDQCLAHQLMSLRQDIQQFRLQKCYVEHKEMLEDAIEKEAKDEYADLCDAPPDLFSPTLKDIGVTRMNINRRRFSVF